MDMDLTAAQNLQGEEDVDRSNDWTVFNAADGSKCLNTGVSIFQLLDGNEYAALRSVSSSAKSSATGDPLLLYPYQNAETKVVVEPGREYLLGSMPYITEIMARIAANEAWQPPTQTPEATVKQQMASARAQFDLGAGADEQTVLTALEKQFADIDREEAKQRAEKEEDDDVSFSDLRNQIDGGSDASKSTKALVRGSESSSDSSECSESSASDSESDGGGDHFGAANGDAFEQKSQQTFDGAVETLTDNEDDIALPGGGVGGRAAPLLQNVAGGGDDLSQARPSAAAAEIGFAGTYGRLAQPAASFGIPLRDLEASGDAGDDSDFDSEEQRKAAREEAQHAATMPDFLALMKKSDAIDSDRRVNGDAAGSQNATNAGYFDEHNNFVDEDGGWTTPDGSYYARDGTFAGMVDETGGFYDARDGSYTDASGARFEESDFERSGLHATEQVGAHSNDSDEKSDAFEIFNGQKLPVVAPSERKSTDLVGLSTREARRAQKERQRGESAIAASRRTITQASESERQSKQRTLGDELKEFNLPQDLLKQFADQGALDKPIGGGGEEVTDFADIAHMGKRLLSRKDKKVDAHEEKSTNAGDATQQPVAAESAQTVLQTPPPPLQPELQTLGQYFEPPPQSANGQTVSNNARKTALLDLARASAAQMEATAAQWRAMATLFESAE